MFEAIRHNLTNLTNLSGRDTRATFWFYVLFLVVIQFVVTFVLSMFSGGAMVVDALQSARGGMDEAEITRQMMAHMGDTIRVSMWGSVIVSFVMTLLLVAAFTRRLHDSSKPGWIAACLVALQLLSIGLTIGMIGDMVELMSSIKPGNADTMKGIMAAQQSKYAFSGGISWIPTLIVIVFGVWPSTDGDNRYGPEPDHI